MRGSVPSPGPSTAKYGGNTSCVYIELDNGNNVILDSGTGIRLLGQKLITNKQPINIILSHGHWDHIQGYPFFTPIYQPEREINLYACRDYGERTLCPLFDQMDGHNFPIKAEELLSNSNWVSNNIETVLLDKDIHIVKKGLNHPGGGSAYIIKEDGISIAYVTDNELDPPYKVHTTYDEWVDFCHGVDILIHDAQYTEDDMPHKHGWGHSLISQVRQLAVDAEVKTLVMFHHDPDRSDAELDEIQIENKRYFKAKNTKINSYCAGEGMEIKLSRQSIDKRTIIEVT